MSKLIDLEGLAEFKTLMFSAIYPVGSIYMSINDTNPGTLFGGTWEQLENRFLLGAGSSYSAGATGGEETHTLTINEMPMHTHQQQVYNGNYPYPEVQRSAAQHDYTNVCETSIGDYHSSLSGGYSKVSTLDKGGGQSHNNMPPYLVVYMWKRIA